MARTAPSSSSSVGTDVGATPPVSVVVATHNRRSEFLVTLDRLSALTERPPTIVVCGAVVRRSAFLEVGGFCELLLLAGEEELLALDLAQSG